MVGNFGALFEQDWAGRNLQREQSVIQSMCQTASGRVEECSIDRVGMIVVLADSAGDIRAWVEQVASRRPEIPIVFVTPAEIGPLAQPYLTRANMALITGLRDALALQALGGTVDEALARRTEATEAGGALFGLLLLGGMLPAIWTGRQARRRAKATIWDR
jgi:mannitol-1-phosphate/altronate dehydrogenase